MGTKLEPQIKKDFASSLSATTSAVSTYPIRLLALLGRLGLATNATSKRVLLGLVGPRLSFALLFCSRRIC